MLEDASLKVVVYWMVITCFRSVCNVFLSFCFSWGAGTDAWGPDKEDVSKPYLNLFINNILPQASSLKLWVAFCYHVVIHKATKTSSTNFFLGKIQSSAEFSSILFHTKSYLCNFTTSALINTSFLLKQY